MFSVSLAILLYGLLKKTLNEGALIQFSFFCLDYVYDNSLLKNLDYVCLLKKLITHTFFK